jgi:Domain of unknown function (DUF6265)
MVVLLKEFRQTLNKNHGGRSIMLRSIQILVLSLLVCGSTTFPLGAQETSPPRVPAPAQKASSPQATLADFAWLAGGWQGELSGLQVDQSYMAPKNGLMLGDFRMTDNQKTLFVEIFTFLETKDGVDLYVRHFSPELRIGQDEKDRPLLLKLVRFDSKQAEFRTPEGAQPIRDTVTRTGDDSFAVHLEISGDNGKTQTIDISYHRVK